MNWTWGAAGAIVLAVVAVGFLLPAAGPMGTGPTREGAQGTAAPACWTARIAVKDAYDRVRDAEQTLATLEALPRSEDPTQKRTLSEARKDARRSQNALEAALVRGREMGCTMPGRDALEALDQVEHTLPSDIDRRVSGR